MKKKSGCRMFENFLVRKLDEEILREEAAEGRGGTCDRCRYWSKRRAFRTMPGRYCLFDEEKFNEPRSGIDVVFLDADHAEADIVTGPKYGCVRYCPKGG